MFRKPPALIGLLALAALALAVRSGPASADMVAAVGPSGASSLDGASRATAYSSEPTLLNSADDASLVHSVLYDGTTLFTGVQFARLEFHVPGAGQVNVLLDDLQFPSTSGLLTFALVDGGTVLGLINGSGSLQYAVDGARTLFGYVYAVASPGANAGSYYLGVTHDGPSPVPLPPAVGLLLAGLAAAGGAGVRVRRRNANE
jgi:hypothetical protein